MKCATAVLLLLTTLAISAPTPGAEEQSQLVEIHNTGGSYRSSISVGDHSEPPSMNMAIFARKANREGCRVSCAAADPLPKSSDVDKARNCLINALDGSPGVSRASRSVAYCRKGDAVVALCANRYLRGSPLDSGMIGVYDRILSESCSPRGVGAVNGTDTIFWRGTVGDEVCGGMAFDLNIGPFGWTVNLDGPRVSAASS